ncbi:hypothetical protein CHLNCDRAFT_141499 [Chlorella variabilis]|uniref:Sulfotransferase n=1 Tax=Chlorella variabilis TaxID=554065 RepID=E1ZSZ8_CHLVA|nr:hypothetical protein CHLNCDRAFT_141499 [Chlorella variabilis]EFN51025.1 hypothetical protein CHLNCDRAFT_141499 [Chlorella variabilis]|eukprot:XP_005843127.1 hypothetical protein CHLNCDRAFT_141499 [Chlorella variabilis]
MLSRNPETRAQLNPARKGRPVASSRAVRLGVVAAFAALLLYSTHSVGRSGSRELLEEASEGDDDGPQLAGASLVGGGVGSGGSSKEASLAVQPPVRRKYGLSDGEIEAAVLAGSQQHGEVSKAGPLPADFWTADKRPWREEVFNAMVARDMAQPRSSEYWESDATGELALKPLALPFPLCHTYVNHKYKVIFIIHPKSASTATKRYMTLCRLERTDSCLSPLENATELAPLEERWREYFVFTFVRNPWVRAYSSWKFLREGFMLRAGSTGRRGAAAAPCAAAAWRDFCGDPLLLGRLCLAQPHCCPGKEKAHFMFYHITDQATCLLTAGGQLAVDFIGRVEAVDEDMAAAVRLINSRLPQGVAPLELPQGVQARNVGPQGGGQAPDNARYLPAFQGANATCFSRLARFYAKDVALMFPALAAEEEEAGREAAAGAGAAAGEALDEPGRGPSRT